MDIFAMKKLIFLLLVFLAAFFALRRWSPGALDRITGVFSTGQKETVPADPQQWLPAPEPAPVAKPAEPAPPPAVATVRVDKAAQVIVFCYHRFEGASGGILSIAPELFEQQMQRLRDNDIHVISMQDFLSWRRNEKSIPPKSAIISIDDGYVSAFEVARPILKKFGYPWTCFIYTKFIASGGKSLSWEQLGELRDEGVEIGCHSISHIALSEPKGKSPEVYEAWLRDEIIESKKLIERKLAIKCAVFAYPEGKWSRKVLDVIKDAGYAAAFTVYGQRVTHGAHAERIGRFAWSSRRPQDMEMALKFEGPLSASETESPTAAEMAAAAMLTQPVNEEVITDPEPVLKANLSSLGTFDESSLTLRLSSTGPIPFKYDRPNKIIEARPPQALKPGEYTVVVTAKADGKRVEMKWSFRLDPAGGLSAPLESFSAAPPRK